MHNWGGGVVGITGLLVASADGVAVRLAAYDTCWHCVCVGQGCVFGVLASMVWTVESSGGWGEWQCYGDFGDLKKFCVSSC